MEWDKEAAQKATEESLNRIKAESTVVKPKEDNFKSEQIWFEDGIEVTLSDGNKFKLTPVSLKQARRVMQILKTVNVDLVVLNFAPTEDPDLDEKRQSEFLELMEIAFSKYGVDKEYIEDNIDVLKAVQIIDIMLGLNGLKK